MLIEEARSNIYLDSANLTTVNWVNSNNAISATGGTSPANTNTANSVTPNNGTGAGSAQVYQTQACAASTAYTYSIYLKANGMTTYQLRMIIRQGGGAYIGEAQVNVDLSAVSVATATSGTPPTNVSATITAAGNSWYRVTVTGTTTSLTGLIRCGLYNLTTGNGTSGVLAWGVQVEAGAFATSYIPTTTTALTRNADVANMTGTNFSDWYNATANTFFAQWSSFSVGSGTNPMVFTVSDGTTNNLSQLYVNNSTSIVWNVRSGAADSCSLINAGSTAGTTYKASMTSAANSFAASLNSLAPSTDNTGAVPVTPNRMGLGNRAGALFLNGYVQKLSVYPQRLLNAELQATSK